MFSQNLSKLAFVVFLLVFLLFPRISFAAAPQITAYPSGDISLNQSFTVSATMSGLTKNAVYRMRIVLAPQGTSNYFGSTWNGISWYNGTPSPIDYTNFLSITTDGTGAWYGDMQGEVDADDPNFTTGSGTYDLKVGRYTQTGSSATWSNIISVTIVLPPTATSTPIPPPTNTPTPIIPTARPIATATSQPMNSPTHSADSGFSTPTIVITSDISSFGAILGTSSARSPTIENKPTLVAAEADHKEVTIQWIPIMIIIAGFGLLGSCGILIALQTEKGKQLWKKFF